MRFQKADYPPKIRPFVALGFIHVGVAGEQYTGDCPFCAGTNKCYINQNTGQWDCKRCGKRGNIPTFFQQWQEEQQTNHPLTTRRLNDLSENRGLPASALKAAGLFWDGTHYVFPVKNETGGLVNFRKFQLGGKLMGLAGVGTFLWGIEAWKPECKRILLVEGEWDLIALRCIIEDTGPRKLKAALRSGELCILATPGANTWKEDWHQFFGGREVDVFYDNDQPGRDGVDRVFKSIGGRVKRFRAAGWPDDLPKGFDIRDFHNTDGNWETLEELLAEKVRGEKQGTRVGGTELNPEGLKGRPSFEQVLDEYSKVLVMTPAARDALKVLFGITITQQINGDPTWLHLVGAAGSGKTELLSSLADCHQVVTASSITPTMLVSGFPDGRNGDPSLLPKLIGKVFILKDFTEVLSANKLDRDKLFSILRGAYDGKVERSWGNGVERNYEGYFTMMTGTTSEIDAETSASLGERFLKYRMDPKADKFGRLQDSDRQLQLDIGLRALSNIGKEKDQKVGLEAVAADFLNRLIELSDLPDIPLPVQLTILHCAEVCSLLRTTLTKDGRGERLLYRPQPERLVRLGKQFMRALLGLSMVNSPPQYLESDLAIVQKIAIDTAIPFHVEIVKHIMEKRSAIVPEIAVEINIPKTTLREALDTLEMIGVVEKVKSDNPAGRGAPVFRWQCTRQFTETWKKAGLK